VDATDSAAVELARFADQKEAVRRRHDDIGDQQIDLMVVPVIQRVGGRGADGHLVAAVGTGGGKDLRDGRFIVDDQDLHASLILESATRTIS
jgi:hypothetical protein